MSISIVIIYNNSERYYNTDSVLYHLLFLRRQPATVAAFVALKIFMICRLRPIALIPIFYYNENIKTKEVKR